MKPTPRGPDESRIVDGNTFNEIKRWNLPIGSSSGVCPKNPGSIGNRRDYSDLDPCSQQMLYLQMDKVA
jgi:hypothetical protein